MTTDSPARQIALHRASDPMTCTWGCYLAPSSGEGDGLLWFKDAAELQDFVSGPLWPALLGVEAAPETSAALRDLFSGRPALSWSLLEEVNLWIEPAAQIHWWGNLRQLYEGQDPFAKDLREAWRQHAGEGIQDFSALEPAQRRGFCDFLRTVFA